MSNIKPSWMLWIGTLVVVALIVAFGTWLFTYERTTYTYAFDYFTYSEIELDERYIELNARSLAKPEWRSELYTLIEIVNSCAGDEEDDAAFRCQSASYLLYGAMWQIDQDETIVDCELALKMVKLLESDFKVSTGMHKERAFGGLYASGTSEPLGAVISRVLMRKCYQHVNTTQELENQILMDCS